MIFFLETLRLLPGFWSSGRGVEILGNVEEEFSTLSRELVLLRRYSPLKGGVDVVLWLAAKDPELVRIFRRIVRTRLGGYSEEVHSFLSMYRESQYGLDTHRPADVIAEAVKIPYKYLVAYPMKKSPEWYLLSQDERRRIMAEHAGLARSLAAGKRIRSYTTYSFGVDDNEFLVLYELEDLEAWSLVVEKLREASHRRWVVREEPLIVGSLIEDLRLVVETTRRSGF